MSRSGGGASSVKFAANPQLVRAFHFFLGGLFLVSALLKASFAANPSSGLSRIVSSEMLESLLVGAEVLVGLGLVSFVLPQLMHLLALLLFSGFTAASGWMLSVGVSECGCFGSVSINPVTTLVVDVAILVLLCASWQFVPAWAPSEWVRLRPVLVAGLSSIAVFGGVLVVTSIALRTTPASLRHRLAGRLVTAQPEVLSVGRIEQGVGKNIAVTLANHADQPIQIVGASQNCEVSLASELPLVIAANSQLDVEVIHHGKGTPGLTHTRYAIFVDDGFLKSVPVQFEGQIE